MTKTEKGFILYLMAGKKHLDARQSQFLQHYYSPDSPTFLCAEKSALKAGYRAEYANNLTSQMPKWLSVQLGYKDHIITKAKNRLEEFIDEKSDKRVASDMVKFALKTLGKDEGFTERVETTSKNLNINVDIPDSEFQEILSSFKRTT